MIIIFGTKVRYKTLSTGQFYCPHCQTKRAYELREARNWFAMYFVPIFPLGRAGELVTCLTCGMNFQTDALSIPVPGNAPLDRFVRDTQADLNTGTPIEMARQKLINTGLSRDLIEQVIAQAAGPERKRCPADGFTYRASVERCAQCGAVLENLG